MYFKNCEFLSYASKIILLGKICKSNNDLKGSCMPIERIKNEIRLVTKLDLGNNMGCRVTKLYSQY